MFTLPRQRGVRKEILFLSAEGLRAGRRPKRTKQIPCRLQTWSFCEGRYGKNIGPVTRVTDADIALIRQYSLTT